MWKCHLIVAREKFCATKGQMSIVAIVGCLILLVAYMMTPETFHDFARFMIKTLREAVRDSFSGYGNGGPPEGDDRLAGGSQS